MWANTVSLDDIFVPELLSPSKDGVELLDSVEIIFVELTKLADAIDESY